MFRSGFVSLVGRANVGKSTLLNAIMGQKVSIVSRKPQTTRNNVRAIATGEDYQIVFIDTPGMHKPKNKLGEFMVSSVHSATKDIDAVVYVFDANVKAIPKGDLDLIEMMKNVEVPIFLVLNKVDLVVKENLLVLIDELSKLLNPKAIIPISALKNDGVDILVDEIKKILPKGPKYYPDDMFVDSTLRELVAEVIREKVLSFTSEEVPHGVGVEVIQFTEPTRPNGVYHIEATIYCEKNSHKGILIGKEGRMLKRIGQTARVDIENLVGGQVNLKLWVKVKDDWRNNSYMLKELGYKE